MPDQEAQRAEDSRVAAAARLREATLKIAQEDRAQFWDQLGYNVRSDAGLERLRVALHAIETLGIEVAEPVGRQRSVRAIEWLYAAYEGSITRNKRLLYWIMTLMGLATGIVTLIKFVIEYPRHL